MGQVTRKRYLITIMSEDGGNATRRTGLLVTGIDNV